jgi:Late competence development protein ComFB
MNPEHQSNSYKNVMELLVDAEIDRQTAQYSVEDAHTINRIEIAAYALNLLPPLYASSQEGVDIQLNRGQKEFSDRIQQSVLQALKSIKKHPQRETTPFTTTAEISPELQSLADSLRLPTS